MRGNKIEAVESPRVDFVLLFVASHQQLVERHPPQLKFRKHLRVSEDSQHQIDQAVVVGWRGVAQEEQMGHSLYELQLAEGLVAPLREIGH